MLLAGIEPSLMGMHEQQLFQPAGLPASHWAFLTPITWLKAADSDDEFYWAEREAAGGWGGWDGSDHDSEDSNAESYFANSYPDDEVGL